VETVFVNPRGFDALQTTRRFDYARSILPVRRLLSRRKPEIVFALYLTSAGVLACLSGHPRVVLSARGTDVNGQIDSMAWRSVFRWQGWRAVRIHTVSDNLAAMLRERAGVPSAKLFACPIGVDTELFSFVEPTARPNQARIISTRDHRSEHDQSTLVRALAILHSKSLPFTITFASASGAECTRRLIAESGLEKHTTFLPGYELKALPSILARHDVYVSTAPRDGTSSSLLEALSTGIFPVVADSPANRPWVHHGENGYLFTPRDPVSLARYLENAISNGDIRNASARSSRDLVRRQGDQNLGMERILQEFQQCLET
jgi:glycosyltransferase involved in cell wall biosynthesis